MRVLKFGGTSVGSADKISKVLDILKSYADQNIAFTVIFSAVGGMTNKLITMSQRAASKNETYLEDLKKFEEAHFAIVRELIDVQQQSTVFAFLKLKINELEDYLQGVYLTSEASKRSLDAILSYGELLNTYIIAQAALQRGIPANFIDARDVVRTDSHFGSAKVKFDITNKNIIAISESAKANFVTGFIASDKNNVTTTLGRGGSDYTASIFGAAIGAECIEIWTDVDGVMTADPRKVKKAFSLSAISYSEAMEMSHFGAKVIYPPTLQPVFTKRIPIYIRNTFKPDFEGTLISDKSGEPHKMRVKGISSIDDVSLVTVQGSGMIGVTGFSARLFNCLAQAHINVILITQASSEHSVTFAVAPGEGVKAKEIIEEEFEIEIETERLDHVKVDQNLSVVAIIGENMSNTPGISGIMFNTLGKNGVNVKAIAQGSSELNVSAVIDRDNVSKALNALHDAYFLSGARTINIFMVGAGLIGSTLLEQIKDQHTYLVENKGLDLRVIAIANSRKMVFNEDGINLTNWKTALEETDEKMSFEAFFANIKALNLQSSVFVDNTSNKEIIHHYVGALDANISIATPNKVASSSELSLYQDLKSTSFKRDVAFNFETNVGAGLPIIGTLQDLIDSGDDILKIEGVLSGSLSYIFNNYDGSTTFKEVVLKAKELGFTEPDPREDLNGMDVARKILILARESGYLLEPADVKVNNILPDACIKAQTVDEFFSELEKADDTFQEMASEAKNKGQKLCFIASLENGEATVDLKAIDASHPLFNLSGSDNMISFTTRRYKTNPLVIKGPGAGAEVTAAGVFADIIKTTTI